MKTVTIELSEKELSHLISDVFAKMGYLKDNCITEEELMDCGYYSRKELKEKLQKIEDEEFPQIDLCSK